MTFQRATPLLILFATLLTSFSLSAGNYRRVVIDPGHGGKDKGSHRDGILESDLTLKVALKVETLLKARGIPVTLTRRSNQWVTLSKRAEISNNYRNALFVSIHFNTSLYKSAHGVETYYTSPSGKRLADSIQKKMVEKLGLRDRKVKRNKTFATLKKTHGTAVLVECGYLSNYDELQICKRSWFHSLAASAIADGILANY